MREIETDMLEVSILGTSMDFHCCTLRPDSINSDRSNIKNTLVFMQLVNSESDGYDSATATTVQEAKNIEAGFDYDALTPT